MINTISWTCNHSEIFVRRIDNDLNRVVFDEANDEIVTEPMRFYHSVDIKFDRCNLCVGIDVLDHRICVYTDSDGEINEFWADRVESEIIDHHIAEFKFIDAKSDHVVTIRINCKIDQYADWFVGAVASICH